MIVYLDTSVVLRILFGEANPVSVWRKWDKAYSSALWRIEALRTIDRTRLTHEITDTEVAALVREVQIVHETLAICPMDDKILRRAGETFPTVVGTLDAIHLSSALSIHEFDNLDAVLTHDQQLGTAARSLGFNVIGTD
jgi:predicted nucleic acid-binding protein